ncbi:MAG TPA: shikimate dehydrogenase [Thermoleophilaceae bacterium]|nr:shikimate dehydrogenase [Thermoleophilaceae bacterium]
MTALAGVLGHPVAHSRSPAMHNAAFGALGLDWRYVRLPVPPALFAETTRALPGSGYRGANVTIPHKVAALSVADTATAAAVGVGAANTLSFAVDGAIEADNTDAGGFLDALGELPRGRRALVLGAGGAGRAVAWALREEGAAEVLIWNRTPERASELARELGLEPVSAPRSADIVVNATSVGREAADAAEAGRALGLARLDAPAVAVDLVYAEEPTPVVAWAERVGARVVDGLEVLVRQGARSFARWTGEEAPLDVMRAAARAG